MITLTEVLEALNQASVEDITKLLADGNYGSVIYQGGKVIINIQVLKKGVKGK